MAAQAPEALARECDVVATIVGGPDDVVSLFERMLPHARPGTVFLEMTTASPRTSALLCPTAERARVVVLDCPVTGGVGAAQQGTSTHFVGGNARSLASCRSLLEVLAQRVVHCGDAGSGYRMKLINQTMVAGILLGLADGSALARTSGFDAGVVRDALGAGTASGPLFHSYIERVLDPTGAVTFTVGMLRKDLQLARDEALVSGGSVRLLDFALALAHEACERYGAAAGVQSLAAL